MWSNVKGLSTAPLAPVPAQSAAAAGEAYAAYLQNPVALEANVQDSAAKAKQKAADHANRLMQKRKRLERTAAQAVGAVPDPVTGFGLLIRRGALGG